MTQQTQLERRPDYPRQENSAAQPGRTDRALATIRRLSPTLLRLSLAVVFVWFGALKVFDVSPVSTLVANTLPMFDDSIVYLLGAFEIVLGGALVFGNPLAAAGITALHLMGTFLVLIVQPDIAFQNGNPLLLTTEGEFVVKNLVLITAALTVVGLSRPALNAQHRAAPRLTEPVLGGGRRQSAAPGARAHILQ